MIDLDINLKTEAPTREHAIRAHEKRVPKKKRAPKKHVPKKRDPGPIKPGQHLLLKEQMLELVGQSSYSAVWGWMKKLGFPLPIALGPAEGRTTKVAWVHSEVLDWLAARPRRDIGGLKQLRAAQENKNKKKRRRAREASR